MPQSVRLQRIDHLLQGLRRFGQMFEDMVHGHDAQASGIDRGVLQLRLDHRDAQGLVGIADALPGEFDAPGFEAVFAGIKKESAPTAADVEKLAVRLDERQDLLQEIVAGQSAFLRLLPRFGQGHVGTVVGVALVEPAHRFLGHPRAEIDGLAAAALHDVRPVPHHGGVSAAAGGTRDLFMIGLAAVDRHGRANPADLLFQRQQKAVRLRMSGLLADDFGVARMGSRHLPDLLETTPKPTRFSA